MGIINCKCFKSIGVKGLCSTIESYLEDNFEWLMYCIFGQDLAIEFIEAVTQHKEGGIPLPTKFIKLYTGFIEKADGDLSGCECTCIKETKLLKYRGLCYMIKHLVLSELTASNHLNLSDSGLSTTPNRQQIKMGELANPLDRLCKSQNLHNKAVAQIKSVQHYIKKNQDVYGEFCGDESFKIKFIDLL